MLIELSLHRLVSELTKAKQDPELCLAVPGSLKQPPSVLASYFADQVDAESWPEYDSPPTACPSRSLFQLEQESSRVSDRSSVSFDLEAW